MSIEKIDNFTYSPEQDNNQKKESSQKENLDLLKEKIREIEKKPRPTEEDERIVLELEKKIKELEKDISSSESALNNNSTQQKENSSIESKQKERAKKESLKKRKEKSKNQKRKKLSQKEGKVELTIGRLTEEFFKTNKIKLKDKIKAVLKPEVFLNGEFIVGLMSFTLGGAASEHVLANWDKFIEINTKLYRNSEDIEKILVGLCVLFGIVGISSIGKAMMEAYDKYKWERFSKWANERLEMENKRRSAKRKKY